MSMSELKTKSDIIREFMENKRVIGDCQARGIAAITTLYAVFTEVYYRYEVLEEVDHKLVDLTRLLMGEPRGGQEEETGR